MDNTPHTHIFGRSFNMSYNAVIERFNLYKSSVINILLIQLFIYLDCNFASSFRGAYGFLLADISKVKIKINMNI